MTREAWDVPARQARRELEAWSHKWRGLDGGDGARLAGMLARLLIRVTPREKIASLRFCLDALLSEHLRQHEQHADEQALEQRVGSFVEGLQAPPAKRWAAPPAARVLRPPWRCRWFGHAWRKGNPRLGGPVLFCSRAGCVEEHHWPPPPVVPPSGVVVGVAGGDVPAGALVTVTLPSSATRRDEP